MAGDGRWSFTPSEQLKLYIEQVKEIGTYGKTRGAVINHIVGNEIMGLLRDKTLTRLTREQEREFAALVKEDDED